MLTLYHRDGSSPRRLIRIMVSLRARDRFHQLKLCAGSHETLPKPTRYPSIRTSGRPRRIALKQSLLHYYDDANDTQITQSLRRMRRSTLLPPRVRTRLLILEVSRYVFRVHNAKLAASSDSGKRSSFSHTNPTPTPSSSSKTPLSSRNLHPPKHSPRLMSMITMPFSMWVGMGPSSISRVTRIMRSL